MRSYFTIYHWTYCCAIGDRHETGEDGIGKRIARVFKCALSDAVVLGVEAELDLIPHRCCEGIWCEDQASFTYVYGVDGRVLSGDQRQQGKQIEIHDD